MIQLFSKNILQWYSTHKRNLPWRKPGIDPYYVVVSEIMLQQTQVPRVIEKFYEFTALFPTIEDLAAASKADVIQAWSGLGYNRRALLLHKFAQEVVERYQGKIPRTPAELITLSGIGPYSACSIASFAFNLPEPAIDVNVRRIYMRFFKGKDRGLPMGTKDEQELYQLVKSGIPNGKSMELHNALMDFGSLVCTRDVPKCSGCPLQKSCAFFPLYTTEKEKVLFVMEKKMEKGIVEFGRYIPNRIFRGRIVELVRRNGGKEIAFNEFGKTIKKDYNPQEAKWLLGLCEALRKDKLIDFQANQGKITLRLSN